MLTGYLVSEVLRRAADVNSAFFTIEQLRSHLLVSANDMARVAGVRDWGVIVGIIAQIPDVARPTLLTPLVEALSGSREGSVRRVALVGPSGIGKSSLAAAYIADRADSYDWIFWVDCETEESILTSFRHIATFLHPGDANENYRASPSYLCQSVHTELSRTVGQWLIVFDNVMDVRHVDVWVPRMGLGHVIITSIDSAARHGSATVIDVGAMEQSEAVELLCRRLNIQDGGRRHYERELKQLAGELSCWPLALELASGYMETCGIRLDDVSVYLDQLKIRSLSDPGSLPPVYPRTLAAAVSLCLERLRSRIDKSTEEGKRAYLASGMVTYAAFLGSRQLPCHMLVAAIITNPEPEMGPGIWIVLPSIANMGEVVRELRRFSLVSFDQDLPAMMGQFGDECRTVTINAVVQEIIRAEIEASYDIDEPLNRLANHVERWLITSLELNVLERASVLFPHADMLSSHMRRLGVTGRHAALLYGNLAGVYRARGEINKAEELLRAELSITVSGENPDDILVVQTKLMLSDIYLDSPDVASDSFATAIACLEDVAQSIANISATYPEAAKKLALDAKAILERSEASLASSAQLSDLDARFDELAARIGPTTYSDALLAIRKASLLISKNRLGMAERLCIYSLNSGAITGSAELHARRLLVEALVWQAKWQEAQEAHDTFRWLFGSTRLYIPIITQYVHNIGYACTMRALLEGATDAIPLLADLFGWPVISDVMEQSSPGGAPRLIVLKAIFELFQGDYPQAEAILMSVRPHDLREGTLEETTGWCLLWQIARLAVFRATSINYIETVE
jgi:hypothetical protein